MKLYKHELEDDVIVRAHLGTVYDNMLEQNLCRIIEPYSRVQVEYVAKTIKLPMAQVEKKLSQMILDAKFHGILDQGEGEWEGAREGVGFLVVPYCRGPDCIRGDAGG